MPRRDPAAEPLLSATAEEPLVATSQKKVAPQGHQFRALFFRAASFKKTQTKSNICHLCIPCCGTTCLGLIGVILTSLLASLISKGTFIEPSGNWLNQPRSLNDFPQPITFGTRGNLENFEFMWYGVPDGSSLTRDDIGELSFDPSVAPKGLVGSIAQDQAQFQFPFFPSTYPLNITVPFMRESISPGGALGWSEKDIDQNLYLTEAFFRGTPLKFDLSDLTKDMNAITMLPDVVILFEELPLEGKVLSYVVQWLDLLRIARIPPYSYIAQFSLRQNGFSQNGALLESMAMLHTAVLRNVTTEPNARINATIQQFPYYLDINLQAFVLAIAQFVFPLVLTPIWPSFIYLLVLEKETQLRVMMKMMGMKERNYWLTTWCFDYAVWLLVLAIFFIIGLAFQIPIFFAPGVLLVFLLSWGFFLIGSASLVSVFLGRNRTIVTLFLYLIVFATAITGFILNTSAGLNPDFPWPYLMLFPPFAFYRGLSFQLQNCVEYNCMSFNDVFDGTHYGKETGVALIYLWVETVVVFAAFWYLKDVAPQQYGVQKHFLHCFGFGRKRKAQESGVVADGEDRHSSGLLTIDTSTDADVLAERKRVLTTGGRDPVVVDDLFKHYDGAPETAVAGVTFGMRAGECFGLLGPNGSGKTTTIGMLTGLHSPTGGSARISGYDCTTEADLAHTQIGVCPQFDVHWPDLTVADHLLFYARLKGTLDANPSRGSTNSSPKPETELDRVKRIADLVGLGSDMNKKSKELSGGMRRRLSVAIALCGESPIIFLDEPTTGLDVSSRRQLWDVLDTYRREHNATLLLTTHSMEEADTLCSRIAIIAKGRLRAIGTPTHLKSKFGSGYSLSVSYAPGRVAEGQAVVLKAFGLSSSTASKLQLVSEIGLSRQFRIDADQVVVSSVMSVLKEAGATGSSPIVDWGLSQTSLEEVFMSICRDPSAGAAVVTGVTDLTSHDDDNSTILSVDPADASHDGPVLARTNSAFRPLGALLKKNLLLAIRNWSWVAILTPILICAAIFGIQAGANAGAGSFDLKSPKSMELPSIRSCSDSPRMSADCVTLAYAPGSFAEGASWIKNIATNNKLTSQAFNSEDDLINERLKNPNSILFGIVFDASNGSKTTTSYKILFDGNMTATSVGGASGPSGTVGDPRSLVRSAQDASASVLLALDEQIISTRAGTSHTLRSKVKSFPLAPNEVDVPSQTAADIGALLFFVAPAILGFIFLYQFVQEKELNLRAGMEMIGLRSGVYWAVWFITAQIYNALMMLVLVLAGAAFRFSLFNGSVNFVVLYLVFFLFGTAMLSLFFLLSTIISTRSGANNTGVAILMGGLILQIIVGNELMMEALYNVDAVWWISLFKWVLLLVYPPFNFAKVYWDMEAGSEVQFNPITNKEEDPLGYSWVNLTQTRSVMSPFGGDAATELPSSLVVLGYMVLNSVVFLVLGAFFDQVLYYKRPAYFLFQKSTWQQWLSSLPFIGPIVRRSIHRETRVEDIYTDPRLAAQDQVTWQSLASGSQSGIDPDIASEIRRATKCFEERDELNQVVSDANDANDEQQSEVVVNIVKLSKIYRNNPLIRTKKDKFALKNTYLAIEANQVFCLLGHNGAGKTTMLHVLNGLFPPSGGTAVAFGYDVRYDMAQLRELVGLCPQHDILWPDLTAAEHLRLFAAIKGVTRADTERAVASQLREVSLSHVANNKASTFSGGMKRRLSVAVASIGNPKLVFMDEGTTGLDPVSKRGVWNLVENLKRRCTVILTTHSLEEADYLSDRIAIMAEGEVRALGSPLHLKNRHGNGYRVHITCEQLAREDESEPDAVHSRVGSTVREFVQIHAPHVQLLSDNAGNLTFGADPKDLDEFVNLIALFEDKKVCPPEIRAWGISQTTLEDVFIRVTDENAGEQWFGDAANKRQSVSLSSEDETPQRGTVA